MRAFALAASILVIGVGSAGAAPVRSAAARLPLLAPAPELSIDRDLPAAVKARLERERRKLDLRARAAGRIRPTIARGCERTAIPGAPGGLGPPAPQVRANVLGHHVEVVFRFARLPQSPACRPWELSTVTYNKSSGARWVEHYWLRGPRGRVVTDLPWYGRPPYRLVVIAETINGLRSRYVEQALRCPRGCLPGYSPPPHASPLPKPVLPVRALDRPTLEATLRYALAGERLPPVFHALPRSSSCPSLGLCVVTYVDPAFPRSPYRVRYRIAGEQSPGCWMGLRQRVVDRLPFPDAYPGRFELGACASWLH